MYGCVARMDDDFNLNQNHPSCVSLMTPRIIFLSSNVEEHPHRVAFKGEVLEEVFGVGSWRSPDEWRTILRKA